MVTQPIPPDLDPRIVRMRAKFGDTADVRCGDCEFFRWRWPPRFPCNMCANDERHEEWDANLPVCGAFRPSW